MSSPTRFRHVIESLESRIAPAAVALSVTQLNGKNGFTVLGKTNRDYAGHALSAAGDVNGDGFADFIVGADKDGGINDYHGAAYVVFGTDQGFPKSIDVTKLDGTAGFKITGAPTTGTFDSRTGTAVSGGGDIDGDGFDDLIVGSRSFHESGGVRVTGTGFTYVVFGKHDAFAPNLDVATMTAGDGFAITAADNAGSYVSTAGDVNGDHLDDLLVGGNREATGAVYVVFGKTTSFGTSLDVSSLNGTTGFKINGESNSGLSRVSHGDVNGDQISDIVLGAPFAASGVGAAYVVFGKNTAFTSPLELSSLNGNAGFKLTGVAAAGLLADTLSAESDINGDGFDDLIVSASEGSADQAYVLYGKASGFTSPISVTALTGAVGFKINGNSDYRVENVAAGGDFNGDGIGDLIVGTLGVSNQTAVSKNSGNTFVIYGRASGFENDVELSSIHGGTGFVLRGINYTQSSIRSDFAGDIDGDGFDDLLVGTKLVKVRPGKLEWSGAYVVFGSGALGIAKDGHTATLFDSDGDVLTVKTTRGTLQKSNFTLTAGGGLTALNLGAGFTGASVTISAAKVKGGVGDGTLSVDKINALGIDLGTVTVKGRLEEIFAGNNTLDAKGKPVAALKALAVDSLGESPSSPGSAVDYQSIVQGPLGALTVKFNVLNATIDTVGATGAIGKVSIGGNLDGSGGSVLGGLLRSSGDIGAVTIKGSLIGGSDSSGIVAGGKLGKVSIGAALTSADPARPVIISALGKLLPAKATEAVAIAGLTVKTDVLNARILAGYNSSLAAANIDAGIGAIGVGGNWSASSVAAGVKDTSIAGDLNSAPNGFGRNDSLIGGDPTPAIFATVASITVKGTATGSVPGGDFFGVTAQRILKAKFGATTVTLTTGAEDELLDSTNNDFRLVDFA